MNILKILGIINSLSTQDFDRIGELIFVGNRLRDWMEANPEDEYSKELKDFLAAYNQADKIVTEKFGVTLSEFSKHL